MSAQFRLPHPTIRSDQYFPVRAFLNAVPNTDFIEMLEYLAKGTSYSENDIECAFPESLDPWEEAFEGLRFTAGDECIVLSYQDAYAFMQQACQAYLEERPNDTEKVHQILKQFFDRYCR